MDESPREKQQRLIAEKRSKEAHIRPDPVHRALMFLLAQTSQNNPDSAADARYHLAELDAELGENAAEEIPGKAADPIPANPSPEAKPAKQSVRFKRQRS